MSLRETFHICTIRPPYIIEEKNGDVEGKTPGRGPRRLISFLLLREFGPNHII
jgi:hypothetical protein